MFYVVMKFLQPYYFRMLLKFINNIRVIEKLT